MKYSITAISLLSVCFLTSCSMFKGGNAAAGKKMKTEQTLKNTEQTPQEPVDDISSTVDDPNDVGNREKDKNQGRTIQGFIEPDVTQLPDNKDLLESLNVAPIPKKLAPEVENPLNPLLEDPNAPLPDN